MKKYLEDATNFDGKVKKQPTELLPYECPVCKGYGGWNSLLNEYGPGKHFGCFCSQCWGYGFVSKEDLDCIHDFVETHYTRSCMHYEECKKCGKKRSYDSSD